MAEIQHTPRKVLVTGGAGFIGSNLVRYLLSNDDAIGVVNLDALTYSGSAASLTGLDEQYPNRYRFVQGDICDRDLLAELFDSEGFDTVIHLAAESHVDRSIDGPGAFVKTNVIGTFALLESARSAWAGQLDACRFHHVSTDEVFGSLGPEGLFTETTPYDPRSPYSASKAGADHLVRAWAHTYGMNVTISNCSNNFGPWQFPEKLIPLMISKCLSAQPLPVYGDGLNVRDWLYVVDHCEAIDRIVRQGQPGRTYNVGGGCEQKNLDLVKTLCRLMDSQHPPSQGQSYEQLIAFVTDRPGHDRRYAIDSTRISQELGWQPRHDFATALDETVRWYLANRPWVEAIEASTYDGKRLGLDGKEG